MMDENDERGNAVVILYETSVCICSASASAADPVVILCVNACVSKVKSVKS